MIEFLAAMLVLAITVGGIAAASIGAGRISQTANRNARLNVAMTAFAEVVKSLPYVGCTDSDVYQNAFDSGPDDDALKVTYAVDMDVTAVDLGPDCSGGGVGVDSGVQTITLQLADPSSGDVLLDRQIVKRSPDPAMTQLDFHIADPTERTDPGNPASALRYPQLQRSAFGDPLVVWGLMAYGASEIYKYEWWCDGEWERQVPQGTAPAPDFTTYSPDDPAPECQYPARPRGDTSDSSYVVIALRVTEAGSSGRVGTTSERFLKTDTEIPHTGPFPQISLTSPGECDAAVPCILGPGNAVDVTMVSSGPDPADGAVVMWEWTFGDNTPGITCGVSAADPTGQLCRTQSHRYEGGGEFPVTLRLTDNFGASGTTTRNIRIAGTPIIRPTIAAADGTTGVTATPAAGLSGLLQRGAPGWWGQIVAFNAAGTHANGFTPGAGSPPGGIKEYRWDFGDGTPVEVGTASTTTHEYVTQVQRDFTLTLTVTDVNDFTMTATATVNVAPIQPPRNITVPRAIGDAPFRFRNARIDLQWTNPPQWAPGDAIHYEVRLNRTNGTVCSLVGAQPGARNFTFPGGEPSATTNARLSFSSWPPGWNGVCWSDNYEAIVTTVVVNARGTFKVASAPIPVHPEF